MRKFLALHPEQQRSFSPEELDMLDALVTRVVGILGITDEGERNEAAARILPLYTPGGRTFEEIVQIAVRLHQQRSPLRRTDTEADQDRAPKREE